MPLLLTELIEIVLVVMEKSLTHGKKQTQTTDKFLSVKLPLAFPTDEFMSAYGTM